jgi:hypothetical protein
MRFRAAIVAVLSTGLAGCLANYAHAPGEPTARLKVERKATPMICVDERPMQLMPDAEGYARVPAGRPVTIAAQWEGHDFVCIPSVTLTFEPDASYAQSFSVRSRACMTTISKESPGRVVPVASSDPASYGCRGRP